MSGNSVRIIGLNFAASNMIPNVTLVSFLIQTIKLFLRDPIVVLSMTTAGLVRLTSATSPRVVATTTTSTTLITIPAPIKLSLK